MPADHDPDFSEPRLKGIPRHDVDAKTRIAPGGIGNLAHHALHGEPMPANWKSRTVRGYRSWPAWGVFVAGTVTAVLAWAVCRCARPPSRHHQGRFRDQRSAGSDQSTARQQLRHRLWRSGPAAVCQRRRAQHLPRVRRRTGDPRTSSRHPIDRLRAVCSRRAQRRVRAERSCRRERATRSIRQLRDPPAGRAAGIRSGRLHRAVRG